MISMLIGTVAGQERDGRLVLNCGGVGYSVLIGKRNAKAVEVHGKSLTVYCRQTWDETTGPDLYGWLDETDRELFDRALRVHGIGPERARRLVDAIDMYDFGALVEQGNAKAIVKRVGGTGVGEKSVAALIAAWPKVAA